MPIVNGRYINPQWQNGGPPALDADELNALSGYLQDLDSTKLPVSEATAEKLGLPPGSSADEALRSVGMTANDSAYRVGDIISTIRSDLGDNWALANGALINLFDYPDYIGSPINEYFYYPDDCPINDAYYNNGILVAIGVITSYPYIYYTSRPFSNTLTNSVVNVGSWTKLQISSTTAYQPKAITYADGKWVMVGYNGSNIGYMSTANNIGSWTTQAINTTNSTFQANDILYRDGIWVMCGSGSSTHLLTATDPTGTWTARNGVSQPGYCLYYHDGIWLCGQSRGYLCTATDPTGTWTRVGIQQAIDNASTIWSIIYFNNMWVAAAGAYIYYANDLNGEWTEKNVGFYVQDMTIINNELYLAGYTGSSSGNYRPSISKTTDVTSTLVNITLLNRWSDTKTYLVKRILHYRDDCWIALGHRYYDGSSSDTNYPTIWSNKLTRLPMISSDNTSNPYSVYYNYVKVKE